MTIETRACVFTFQVKKTVLSKERFPLSYNTCLMKFKDALNSN